MVLLLISGCNIRVEQDTFYVPSEKVKTVEIQKEYYNEDGTTYYRKKTIKSAEDLEEICEMVRKLPAVRVPNNETPTIENFALVVIMRGEADHYLILNDEMGFYDRLAYKYTASGVYESFETFYSELSAEEVDTELEWG